jgi:hypothetical protein
LISCGQLLASIFTLVLTASIVMGQRVQTRVESDELIDFVQTSSVRFIQNGLEYSGQSAQGDKRIKAGDRVKDHFVLSSGGLFQLLIHDLWAGAVDAETRP